MKNPIALIIVLLIIILGIIALVLLQKPPAATIVPDTGSQIVNSPNTDTDSEVLETSRYVEYTVENFNNLSHNRRVLFFYANWCPTCRPADESFSQNSSNIPQDVSVIRVNYNDTQTDNNEKELARIYNVTYQHTFVQIDSNGSEIKKWNGGKIEDLLANIE